MGLWLDRSLLQGPRLALVTSERQFQAAMRAISMKDAGPWLLANQHACVHSYDDEEGVICVVALSLPACARMSEIDVAALLAHEAVHVWQRVADAIGGDLGREMEAYAVQNIVANLMRAYVKASSSAAARASAA